MGVAFWLFSYITSCISIIILAISISSGLYLLAEITEEYPTMTCKVLKYLAASLALIQILLWFDGLPTLPSILQLISYGAYASTLNKFPVVQLLSIPTVSSVILFLVTNGFWLYFLINTSIDAVSILGFFLVVVWSLPCGLFISLCANDFILPGLTNQSMGSNGLDERQSKLKQKSIFRASFDATADYLYLVPGIGTVLNMYRMLGDKRR